MRRPARSGTSNWVHGHRVVVVDSAALVDVLIGLTGTDRLRARLSGEELHAPALLDFEVVSALRGLTLGGHLSPARAGDALSDFEDLAIQGWAAADALAAPSGSVWAMATSLKASVASNAARR